MRPSLPSTRLRFLTPLCAAVLTAGAGACSKGGGGREGQDAGPIVPIADKVEATEPSSNAPLAVLEASGRLANKAVWHAPAAGQANGRRSFFTFAAPAAGAFYISKIVVTPVGCDIRQVGTRLFAGRLTPEGQLESWQRIDPFEVIKLGEAQRLLVAAEGDENVVCGDVEVLLAARFLETLKPTTASLPQDQPLVVASGAGPEADPSTGPAPGPAPDSGPASGPSPQPGPSPGPAPAPIPGPIPQPIPGPAPSPVPTPGPDPALPACDGQGPSASDPAILRAALRVYGQRAGGGTCETTLTWRIADLVQRDPRNNCKFPEILVIEGSGSPLLKLQTAAPFANLVWLQLATTGERDGVKAALNNGDAVDLVAPVPFGRPEAERCSVPGSPAAPKLSTDLDLSLFRGDPRESCLGGKGALQYLEFTDAAHDFRIDRTGNSLQFTFAWPRNVVAPTGTLRLRAYDRRLRLFVSDGDVFTASADGHYAATLAGDGGQAALATQGDLELVVSEGTVPAAGLSCQRVLLFPYARYFLDPAFGSSFHTE